MASNAILYQSTCPRTPQQNDIAKRKHHIIEITCTLLLHGKVRLMFLGDVVLTTGFLINRMPSYILNNKVPHASYFQRTLF